MASRNSQSRSLGTSNRDMSPLHQRMANEDGLGHAVERIKHEYVQQLLKGLADLEVFVGALDETLPHQAVKIKVSSETKSRSPGPSSRDISPLHQRMASRNSQSRSLGTSNRDMSPLHQRMASRNSQSPAVNAALSLVETFSAHSAQLLEAWRSMLVKVQTSPAEATALLRAVWRLRTSEYWSESVFQDVHPVFDLAGSACDWQIWKKHNATAAILRQGNHTSEFERPSVEDLCMSLPVTHRPVIFEQRYSAQVDRCEHSHALVASASAKAVEAAPAGSGGDATGEDAGGALPDVSANGRGNPPRSPAVAHRPTATAAHLPPLGRRPSSASASLGQAAARNAAAKAAAKDGKPAHVIVLVHGFQGNSCDMRLLRNNIALFVPDALYLCSTANEDETDGDIGGMGERLAEEVKGFVRDWCSGKQHRAPLGRLSFVAHSIGGLIVRSALPFLEAEFKDFMYTFVSFSTPHLGYIYASNSLFLAGLWVARVVKASMCLKQLSFKDAENVEDSFLVRLANSSGLEHFKQVMLVSSCQDQYAPFESARIEAAAAAGSDSKLGPIYAKMVRSILGRLNHETVTRADVNFHIPERNFDTVIGRAAHIQFIDNQLLMRMFLHTYSFLFE
eukprot:TRINITY_DN5960_c0_g1_i2.p1 TRINITY_DN5960_c0_g1~~TRINITY_DN5960_c0_g1_i2.p1  ORF type:complete len:621 (-),score=119.99 TRINITY_DN5960_c0_g1_i2:127-1989(-)